jgi:hypothetical protein
MTTPSLEARVAHVEGIVGEMRSRLDRIEQRLDRLETRLEELRRDIESQLRTNFQWTVGIMISMWVTTILAILLRT